jgi:DNA polymerase-3 subunit delta
MKTNPEQVDAQLRRGLAPAYLVSGDEPLRVGEAADAIRAAARAAGYEQREVHFVERGFSWEALRGSAATLSLFGDRRLIEVRFDGVSPGREAAEPLRRLVESVGEDTCLLIICGRLEAAALKAGWVAAIEARGVWVAVWPVDGARLAGWIAERCRRAGLEPTSEAVALLLERVEGNLLAAQQEIDKLRLLVDGPRLDAEAVIDAVADSARFEVGALGEAVVGGDTRRALRILDAVRGEGVEPTLVWWALVRELHALWRLRTHGIAVEGRGPRRGERYLRALEGARGRAGRLRFGSLVERAHLADRAIKGRARGDAWDELACLATDLCGARAPRPPRAALRR